MTSPGSIIAPQPGWWVRDENVGANLTGQFGWAAGASGVFVPVGHVSPTYGWAASATGLAPGTPPVFDALGAAGGGTLASTASWTHTATAGAYVLVGISVFHNNPVSSVTYGGTSMTALGAVGFNGAAFNSSGGLAIYGLANAPGGAQTVTVTLSGSDFWANSVSYLYGAPTGVAQTVFGAGTTETQSVTISSNQMVVQMFGDDAGSAPSLSGGTNRYNSSNGGFAPTLTMNDSTSTATFSGTTSGSQNWGGIAIVLRNPIFIGATRSVAPIIAGSLVKIIYISGTPSITPTISAALAKTRHAAAALSVTPTIGASLNLHPALVTAAKTVTPTISAGIAKVRFANAAVTVTPTISAALIKIRHISAVATVTPTIAAAIQKSEHPAATLAVTPTIAAAIAKTIHPAAALSVTPSIGAGVNLHPGLIGAAKTVTPAISAALIKHRFASAAPTITPSISADAAKTIHASAAPTVTPAFAASATKSSGVVTFDAAGTGTSGTATSISWSHTAASGAGIIVGVSTTSSATITGATYGGTAMTNLGSVGHGGSSANGTLYLFGLTTAGTGSAATIVATASASTTIRGGSASYINVLSFGTAVTNSGSGTAMTSGSVSSVTNHRVHCAFSHQTKTVSAFSGTQRYNQGSGIEGGDAAGATTVSFTGTASGGGTWGAVSVDIT